MEDKRVQTQTLVECAHKIDEIILVDALGTRKVQQHEGSQLHTQTER